METQPNSDGVSIDREMAKLAENNLMFQAGIQSLMKKFEALKVTITEGR
jgi:flagellar basal body rod protein FlgB